MIEGLRGAEAVEVAAPALTTLSEGEALGGVARSADEVAAGVKGAEGAATKSKMFSGPTKYARAAEGLSATERGSLGTKLGQFGQAKADMIGDVRESMGLGRTGLFQRGRDYYGEVIANRFPGPVGENLGRAVANSPGAPMTGGRFAELVYEGQKSGVGAAQTVQKVNQVYMPALHATSPTRRKRRSSTAPEFVAEHQDEVIPAAEKYATEHANDPIVQKIESKVGSKVADTVKDNLGADNNTEDTTQSTVRQPQAQDVPEHAHGVGASRRHRLRVHPAHDPPRRCCHNHDADHDRSHRSG